MSMSAFTDMTQPPGLAQRSAVFIDKNGTLIEDLPNNVDPDRLEFRPDAFEALKLLSDQGLALVVVTSEPGLGLGLFNRSALTAVEHAMMTTIKRESGVSLAGFYTCPHKPGPRGEPACLCRMPAAGLLRQAARSLRLDLQSSWMIGDTLNDVEAGRRVGCSTVLIDIGHETNWRMSPLRTPHHRVASLPEAARMIVASPVLGPCLALEIEVTSSGSGSREEQDAPTSLVRRPTPAVRTEKPSSLRIGPLRGFEPHPTREWL